MDKLIYFKIPSCPFCRQADRFLEELKQENEQYRGIPIQVVDETCERAFADSYNYYYVPTFFLGNKKLHEGVVTKDRIKYVLDEYLNKNKDK
ncbi:MAG TPA: thioredoxin family protein [Clostridia bacterium]|jgi:glutaredoxin|nr:MAG: hypothetical protein BWX97_00957 [Firmicutes bacterium ADurb.Bin146]HOD93097.1 thioredoxin family protein [Clostridia bacterium]HQM39420.1 thioredoxin family protein [Clostridia bacterium]